MIEEKIVTVLEFRTKADDVYIDDAMLAVFPQAEWNEVQNRSTFKSESLCNLILTAYFENADAVKSDITHEFDVYSENLVQLTIISAEKPARPTTVTAIYPASLWARSVQQFDVTYNDIVEVLDGDRLTLGIIVHIPHQYYNSFGPVTIDKPHLHYRFSVLLYKPNGRIVLEDVSPTHLLRTYAIEADSQIAALRAASENICVQEWHIIAEQQTPRLTRLAGVFAYFTYIVGLDTLLVHQNPFVAVDWSHHQDTKYTEFYPSCRSQILQMLCL